MTNRELYRAALELGKASRELGRPLRTFLIGLYEELRNLADVNPDVFCQALTKSLECREEVFERKPERPEFRGAADLLVQQIQDLDDMRAGGQLEDPERYFGIKAPGGRIWFNFTTAGYLECGTQGAFGGWDEKSDSGRVLVPGEVAYIDAQGKLASAPADQFENPEEELKEFGWFEIEDFLRCGQYYE